MGTPNRRASARVGGDRRCRSAMVVARGRRRVRRDAGATGGLPRVRCRARRRYVHGLPRATAARAGRRCARPRDGCAHGTPRARRHASRATPRGDDRSIARCRDATEHARGRGIRDRQQLRGRAPRRSDARDADRGRDRRRGPATMVRCDAVRVCLDRQRSDRDRASRPSACVDGARRPVARPRPCGRARRARDRLDVSSDRRRLRSRTHHGPNRGARGAHRGDEWPFAVTHAGPGGQCGAARRHVAGSPVPDAARDPAGVRAREDPASQRRPARREVLADDPDPGRARTQGRSDAPAPPHRLGDHQRAVRRRRARAVPRVRSPAARRDLARSRVQRARVAVARRPRAQFPCRCRGNAKASARSGRAGSRASPRSSADARCCRGSRWMRRSHRCARCRHHRGSPARPIRSAAA